MPRQAYKAAVTIMLVVLTICLAALTASSIARDRASLVRKLGVHGLPAFVPLPTGDHLHLGPNGEIQRDA